MEQEYIVPPDLNEVRLDRALATLAPDNSRATWAKIIKDGHVTVNSELITVGKRLVFTDDVIAITLKKPVVEEIAVPIIYEDDDVLVLDKPTGILTHAKGAFIDEATLADFIRPRTTDGLDTNRPGIVHRLDRDTSGVIIAAKNNEAKRWLQKQFSERKAKKSYIALVTGELKEQHALIDLPIGRDPKKPQLFRVDPNGKLAITEYKVLEHFKEGYSLVQLWPKTGRTHQLRVHMHYLGAPIVGDPFYGGKKAGPRLFLHAASLEITLPSRKREIFSSVLSPDLDAFLKTLHTDQKAEV